MDFQWLILSASVRPVLEKLCVCVWEWDFCLFNLNKLGIFQLLSHLNKLVFLGRVFSLTMNCTYRTNKMYFVLVGATV